MVQLLLLEGVRHDIHAAIRFIQWVASRRAYSARSHSSQQLPDSLHLGVREPSRIADTHRFRACPLTLCQTHEEACYALVCWHLMWWLPKDCPGYRRPGASPGCNAQSSSQASGTQELKYDLGFLASAPPAASQKSRRASAQRYKERKGVQSKLHHQFFAPQTLLT